MSDRLFKSRATATANQSTGRRTDAASAIYRTGHSSELQRLADSHTHTHNIAALQRAERNSKPVQRLRAASEAGRKIVQKVVKTKTGYVDDQDSKILIIQPPNVQEMMRSKDTYLMQSTIDIRDYRLGLRTDVPVLTPHKHLIGESHDASSFNVAVSDWGFGADQMREGLNTHPRMHDVNAETRTTDPQDEAYGSKPLESTVAKGLVEILFVRAHTGRLIQHIEKYLANEEKISVAQTKKSLAPDNQLFEIRKMFATGIKRQAAIVHDRSDEIGRTVANAVTYARSVDETEIGSIVAGPELLAQVVTKGAGLANAMSIVKGELATQALSQTNGLFIRLRVLELFLRAINLLAESFRAIMARDLEAVSPTLTKAPLSPEGVEIGIDTLLNRALDPIETIGSMHTAREHFMATNIARNLTAPGLVQVGSLHLAGLRKRGIPDAVLHEDYAAFKKSTESVL